MNKTRLGFALVIAAGLFLLGLRACHPPSCFFTLEMGQRQMEKTISLYARMVQAELLKVDGDFNRLDPATLSLIEDFSDQHVIFEKVATGGFVIGFWGWDGKQGTDDDYFEYWPPDRSEDLGPFED